MIIKILVQSWLRKLARSIIRSKRTPFKHPLIQKTRKDVKTRHLAIVQRPKVSSHVETTENITLMG